MLRHVVRLAVATLAVAAAGVVVAPPAAQASTCSGTAGVSVVVDFHQLRSGGAQADCDAGGAGKYAAAQFADVGHAVTYVQNEAFVCQVDGLGSPQCARTPPADAYWSLWWSDGKSGTWTYASLGVGSLKVPAGGYVALSWQQGNAQVPPRVAPKAHTAASPTSAPTSHPTAKPSARPTGGVTTAPTSAPTSTAPISPTGSTTPGRGKHHHGKTHAAEPGSHHRASKDASVEAGAPVHGFTPSSSAGNSGGLPGWVAPVAVVVVFALGATTVVLRRKRGGGA